MTTEELLQALGVEVTQETTEQVEALIESETSGLKANRDRFRKERDKAREQLDAFKGFEPEEVRNALGVDELTLKDLPDLIRAARPGPEDASNDTRLEELEGKLQRAEKRHSESAAASEAREAKLRAKLAKSAVDGLVTDAVAEKEGNITLLRPHLVARVRTDVDEEGEVSMTILGANGDPMEDKHGNPATVKALVEEFANSETFAAAFKASGIGGSGARETRGGRTQNNPWAKDTFNLTRQAEIEQSNPQLAQRLKSEAA